MHFSSTAEMIAALRGTTKEPEKYVEAEKHIEPEQVAEEKTPKKRKGKKA